MEWEVVKEYSDEGLSGTLSREKRPALNAFIKDVYRKRFDTVVCWDISRIGRSMKELILFLSDMKDKGIGICSVRQGFDTSTSMGEIMFQFVGTLSSWEREMIRERALAGLKSHQRHDDCKNPRTEDCDEIHSGDCVRGRC
jgi:DNA invertase Pin-like site-specific DNA recombinase